MVDVTLAAAVQLRSMVRAAGVAGLPGVRIRIGPHDRPADDFELLIEDRAVPGDEINEARGIRFYVDTPTGEAIGRVTVDLEGTDFVLRSMPAELQHEPASVWRA